MPDVYNNVTEAYRKVSAWQENFGRRLPDTMAQKYWNANVEPAKKVITEIVNLLYKAESALVSDDRAARDAVQAAAHKVRDMRNAWLNAEWPEKFWRGRAIGGKIVEDYARSFDNLCASLEQIAVGLNELVAAGFSASDSQALAEAEQEAGDSNNA